MVTIQQAAANALATWLAAQLTGVEVRPRWPEPTEELPQDVVTVVMAGPAEDDLLDPIIESQTNDPTLPVATYTYRFRCRRQGLQLDVFTQYDVHRDDILARLDYALNASDNATLGFSSNNDPIRNGLSLQLGDGWVGIAEYLFDSPEVTDTPDAVQQADYHATYKGHVDVMLTYTTPEPVPRLAMIELRQRAFVAMPLTDVARVTADGATFTLEEEPPDP
jgi:hypothetical protein